MTVKLVVLYTPPADADGFDEHYLGVHGPLAQTIPGLLHFESARLVGAADGGAQTYWLPRESRTSRAVSEVKETGIEVPYEG